MNKTNNQQPTALIVSPYLDHLGGGERYMLEIANFLQKSDYKLYVAWDKENQFEKLGQQLGIKLEKPILRPKLKKLYFSNNSFSMYQKTREYDVIFYLSDGSLPLLGGKKNFIHIQVPFTDVRGKSLKNRLKLTKISDIIVNSRFTKSVIDQEFSVNSKVIYPPVTTINSEGSKKPIILSVGRFEPSLNVKKQDILIKAFKKISPKLPNWKLVLAGGLKSSAKNYLSQLKQKTKGENITFLPNLKHQKLNELYQKASIFWHAAGYRINTNKNPELTEHFGITTVEAISAGCIPLVIPKGGQKEIVNNKDFHWRSIGSLAQKTQTIINNQKKYQDLASKISLKRFTKSNFKHEINQLIQQS